ncbi:MAG: sodium-translocating pyrophosphatase [Acidobacteriia bacterium]|nr:sodium-translocating pyrophosphatase [Terriglobia bacterium]
MFFLPLVIGISLLSLLVAVLLARFVLAQDQGPLEMQVISNAIKEGAEAFMRRQNGTILKLAVLLAAVIFILYAFVRSHHEFDPVNTAMQLAFWITLSFVLGAACSVFAGYVGMWVSIRSNIRAASAARTSLNKALQIALRGGAVSGLFVVAMSLFGVGGLFWLVTRFGHVSQDRAPLLIVGYGFGASFVALFAQLGGGIYTKAADVGADLVGKVEAGIPEDDPRNPAVIADLVGDNVGDCAGRGADLFESTAAENIGAMILGATLAYSAQQAGLPFYYGFLGVIMFPLVARAFGLIASIIGIVIVRTKEEGEDPMTALNRGYAVTAILVIVGFFFATRWLLRIEGNPDAWWKFFLCGLIGVLASWAFVWITQYYTEYRFRPVREIATASITGPATNIIAGLAVGMECTMLPVLTISLAILGSYHLGAWAIANGGLFGTAIATMGMLGSAAYILAMDTFGPITDNAGGIVEMSKQPEAIRKKTDRLDAVGNTTKALTKGYAIGSAALAAFLLFSAYMDEVRLYLGKEGESLFHSVDIAKPAVFVGGLLGATLVFFFSALAIKAVGKAAQSVIAEVRAQFREKPGIMQGTEKPDYARCVDIVTRGALKEMVKPGLVAVGTPILVGLIFRIFITPADKTIAAEAVASLLMIGTIGGILMATFMNNGGGAWDNAKKFIESGKFMVDGKVVGKKSEPHKAAVVGDTVGDPFKDTAGPSLHVLVKLLSTITLVLAPLFLK